jgi:DHA1 family bicyclomycin/chloramphenicol resistance-like MFS transporter
MRSRRDYLIILILGALSTVSPFSIDMYLPAFPQIARDLGTTPAEISMSVSGYFIGLALGQLFYGPLLDRFGRKRPLYAGLSLFSVASIGCIFVHAPGPFIAFRLLQALGGCVAQVGAVAMVRDFFPVKESARILATLVLVISVSPLFAPTLGGAVATFAGWPWIFVILAGFALTMIMVIATVLADGHQPDPSISLRPAALVAGYRSVAADRQFLTYAASGALSFAGLFVYVTGSPIIFIGTFHLDPQVYSLVFAGLACCFIVGSQLNHILARHVLDRRIFAVALACQALVTLTLLAGTWFGWFGLAATLIALMSWSPFCGVAYPNAAAIALSPFTRNVGSAAAMLGFLQMGIGALASTGVGLAHSTGPLPIFALMAASAAAGLVVLVTNGLRGLSASDTP